jgi:hypothetical protein
MTRWDPQQKALHRIIGEVLHYRWDPLGVADDPAARTEYDAYAGQVFSKACAGASAEAITAYLTAVTVETMGLASAPDHDARIAGSSSRGATNRDPRRPRTSRPGAVPRRAADGEPRRPGPLTRVWSDESMLEPHRGVRRHVVVRERGPRRVRRAGGGPRGTAVLLGRPEAGAYELAFGDVGRTWSGGGFRARFRFAVPGRLLVSCEQTSAPVELGTTKVANSASIHLRSEPALLDRFVRELAAVAGGHRQTAFLEGV